MRFFAKSPCSDGFGERLFFWDQIFIFWGSGRPFSEAAPHFQRGGSDFQRGGSNSPVVWDDQRLTKLTDTTQQLPPPPATKNLEFPKRNRTSNFGFWPAPKILYAVRMSLRRYPKFYIFTFWHFFGSFWAKQNWSLKIVIIIIGRSSNTTGH